MSQQRYMAAIVGCGRIAGQSDRPRDEGTVDTHAQAYFRHPAFQLSAISEPSHERRTHFQKIWNVPHAYASLGELLDQEQPDIFSVCSESSTHAMMVSEILESARRPAMIFVEKPICCNAEELEAMRSAVARRPDSAVIVNHSRRFDPAHRTLAVLIRDGGLGRLLHGRCDYYGGWLNNGCHVIDTLRMLFGAMTIEEVRPGSGGRGADPGLDVQLMIDEAPVEIVGFDERHYQLFEMDLRFERGRVVVRDFGERIIIEDVQINGIGERVLAERQDSPWRGLESPMLHAVTALASHLRGADGLAASGATLADAGETMKILWQAMERA